MANQTLVREINITWCIEDVQEERPDLSDEQASEVLQEVLDRHDANIGINWDFINHIAQHLFPKEA